MLLVLSGMGGCVNVGGVVDNYLVGCMVLSMLNGDVMWLI